MDTRKYELTVNGSNDCWGQDGESTALSSITDAVNALNTMASDIQDGFVDAETGEPTDTRVQLRDIRTGDIVATFTPRIIGGRVQWQRVGRTRAAKAKKVEQSTIFNRLANRPFMVQDAIRFTDEDGEHTGTVIRILPEGRAYVRWDDGYRDSGINLTDVQPIP